MKKQLWNLIPIGLGLIFLILALFLKVSDQITFLLYLISYLILSYKILIKSLTNLFHGKWLDENFLMAIASIGAFSIGDYKEGIAVILFFKVGEFLEDLAVDRSRKTITDLMDLKSELANVKRGETVVSVSPEEVKIGEHLIVKPGEKIPLDGKVLKGISSLNTASLTGESLPQEVREGTTVLAGAINLSGLLLIEVTSLWEDSSVSKILHLIEEAGNKKTETEHFITKFSHYYTPIVVFSALALFLIPSFMTGDYATWLYRAIVFLVISCPCALVISIPLGFFCGIGRASKEGILMKGSNHLEALTQIDTFIFDKTGTITEGSFEVVEVKTTLEERDLIRIASYAEFYSNHPLALSLKKYYGKEIDDQKIQQYEEKPGFGVSILLEGQKIMVGNQKWLEEQNISVLEEKKTKTALYVGIDGIHQGTIYLEDRIKANVPDLIMALQKEHKNIIVLSGDHPDIVKNVCQKLGITTFYGGLLPNEKAMKVEEFKKKGKVAFMGDGINDAPVLTLADLGISMGGLGSDAAIEASDMVFMEDRPESLLKAIKISRKTQKIVWQNIVFSIAVKGLILILGAIGIANIWLAVFADVGVTLLAILNASRIMKR